MPHLLIMRHLGSLSYDLFNPRTSHFGLCCAALLKVWDIQFKVKKIAFKLLLALEVSYCSSSSYTKENQKYFKFALPLTLNCFLLS